MPIDLPTAKAHLRLDADYPDPQVQGKLNSAIQSAEQFIGRRVFADKDALTAAIGKVPAALEAAGIEYAAAIAAARLLNDEVARCAARNYAEQAYRDAQTLARETYAGISKEDPRFPIFEEGALLILGHFFLNREDVVVGASAAQMPNGSGYVLMPLRVGMGV